MQNRNEKPYLSGRDDNFIRGYKDGEADGHRRGINATLKVRCSPHPKLESSKIDELVEALEEDFGIFIEGYIQGLAYGFKRGIKDARVMEEV